MTYSDDVRAYCAKRYVDAAKAAGSSTIEIPVREVHDALGYSNRFPLVCSAIGSDLFTKAQRVDLEEVRGPNPSSTTVFSFRIRSDA